MGRSRQNAGSVLGKRSHQAQVDASDSASTEDSVVILTPDATPSPKRVKTTVTLLDGDNNKENIPPFVLQAMNASPMNARLTRSLRRTSTMVHDTSSRPSTPRRYASTSNLRQLADATPATSMVHLSLATPPPSPPSALLPLHVRARALLRPTCNDGPQMAGRDQEKAAIESFILAFVGKGGSSEEWSSLYISGSPGTGKTALVNTILAALSSQIEGEEVQVLAINCMALDGVDAVWQLLAEAIGVTKATGRGRKPKDNLQQIVEKKLSASDRKYIVVLDELDHIASSTQLLSPLFTLAYMFSGNLRLIGIANTHTLTSSSATTISVQSLAGVKTLHFAPYTPEQLLGILQARLASLAKGEDASMAERVKKFLPLPTLNLLSKKVAAQTGDVRAVFEVLRGAIDLAVTAAPTSDPLNPPIPAVTPSHVLAALKSYAPAGKTSPAITMPSTAPIVPRRTSDSETVTKIRELGLQQRLVLLAALLATKSTEAGVPFSTPSTSSPARSPVKRAHSSSPVQPSAPKSIGFDIGQLHYFYSAVLGRSENGVLSPVSRSEFGDLAGVLEVVGLLTISPTASLPSTPRKSGKKSFNRSMSFAGGSAGSQDIRFLDGVRLDEVARGLGLGSDDAPADLREEEVRAIFQREQARIAREAKSRAQSARGDVVGFDDAMED